MISIVVIDDGIWTDDTEIMSKVWERHYVDNDMNVCPEVKSICTNHTHGGTCAYIIHDIFQKVCFVSLKVLNNRGKCCGQKLQAALEWCKEYDCDIVHMSLSTRSFYDYQLIKDIISELSEQNKFLVASVDNAGVVSYPAVLKDVFAAFMDNYNIFGEEELGLFYAENVDSYLIGVKYSKRKRNSNGEMIDLSCSNSYAAAALTGYLAKFIDRTSVRIADEVRKAFLKDIYCHAGCMDGELPQMHISKKKRTIPVIGIIQESTDLLNECVSFYSQKGYFVTAFAEKYTEKCIPLCFYFDNQILVDHAFLQNMEDIYKSDLMILQTDSIEKVNIQEMDLLIKAKGSAMEVWAGNSRKYFTDKRKAFHYTIKFLAETEK